MPHQPSPEEIGKAFNAFTAYNFKAKRDRLAHFDLFRWVKVVRALESGEPIFQRKAVKRGWTPERLRKFKATMARKRERLLNGKAAAHVS